MRQAKPPSSATHIAPHVHCFGASASVSTRAPGNSALADWIAPPRPDFSSAIRCLISVLFSDAEVHRQGFHPVRPYAE